MASLRARGALSAGLAAALTVAALAGASLVGQSAVRPGQPIVPSEAVAVIRTHGTVRVIVGLALPLRMETDLSADDAARQRNTIATVQDHVLTGLSRGRMLHKYTHVPYLALQVDEAELNALTQMPQVTSVHVDQLAAPTLAESMGLIGMPATWNSGHTGSGWTVAVLDTGVDKFHPFLVGRVVSEACYSSNFFNVSTSLCPGAVPVSTAPGSGMPCSAAGCDHGTHVAGIAAGKGGSLSGVARDANIISIQVFSASSSGLVAWTSDVMAGLERVYSLRTTLNIAAVNVSLGEGLYTAPCDGYPMKAVIDQLRAAGIATVVASGNGRSEFGMSFPACISTAVSVGSTTDGSSYPYVADRISSFSNTSQYLTLVAPGETINSSVPGGFANMMGTSMAAAHVAGAFTVIRAARPTANVSSILNALIATGTPIHDPRNGVTFRRMNVNAAEQTTLCTYSVTPTQLHFTRSGGTADLAVNTGAGCGWSVWLANAFFSVSAMSGNGPSTVTLTAPPHSAVLPRHGTVTVAATEVAVFQAGVASGDIGGDGRSDLIWQNSATGSLAAWYMDGATVLATPPLSISSVPDLNWRVAGSGDLNGDGMADVVWQHLTEGWLAVWLMNGPTVVSTQFLSISQVTDVNWKVRGVGDLDGDNKADLILQHAAEGWLAGWSMNGSHVLSTRFLGISRVADTDWRIVGAGDTNGDRKADIVWQHQTQGWLAVWYMDDDQVSATAFLSVDRMPDAAWHIAAVGDTSGDGKADLVWQNHSTGALGVWYLDGRVVTGQATLSTSPVSDLNWKIVGPG